MLIVLPILVIVLVYLLAALVPALFLMRYIYRLDTVEKEPSALLVSLIFLGVGAALLSALLENLGTRILDASISAHSPYYNIILAFLVVAAVEEGTKFLLLKKRTWKQPHFNYRFDGVVYAAFISLGFAAFENIIYILGYGLSAAVPRALLAIPGHLGFSVFMGVFFGRAKLCENGGDMRGKRVNLWAGYLSAVALHGFYDACALMGTTASTLAFIAFVVVMYVVVIRLVKKQSETDRPI